MELPSCVDFYRRIRIRRAPGLLQFGPGANLYLPIPVVEATVQDLLRHGFASTRLSRYGLPGDARELQVLSELVRRCLATDAIEPDDLAVTNGSTEAISLLVEHLALRGMQAVIPLPAYFAYELSASRFGMPVAAHYDLSGRICWRQGSVGPLCLFTNSPESVTGRLQTWEDLEQLATTLGRPSFTVYDLIYQIQDFRRGGSPALASAIGRDADLSASAVLFTISKDLCLPGFRAGMIVTQDEALLRHIRSVQFERYFSLNPMCLYLLIVYLAIVLVLTATERGSAPDPMRADIVELLGTCGLRLAVFSPEGIQQLQDGRDRMLRRFQRHFDIFTDISRRVMEIPPTLEPDAGFSALAALSWADPGEAAVVELAQRLSSEYGVGVNPAYIFSGRREDWHRLYPGVTHLRVNVSDDEKALIGTTQRVCAGIEAITRSDPRWRPAT